MTTLSTFSPGTGTTEGELLLEIESIEQVADGALTLTFVSPSGDDLPAWSPGAHVDVILDQVDLTRQYSLCGDPDDHARWRIGVLNAPDSRGGSRHIHENAQMGDLVRVRGPRNNFPLEPAPSYVFIAGGIGITPLLGMITQAERQGADWQLLYGGRSTASMAFRDELAAYGDRVRLFPADEVGLMPLADPELLGTARPGTLVYTCGPQPLMDAVAEAATHWPTGSVHKELFSADPSLAAPGALDSFEVVLQRSGKRIVVEQDKSILEAVEAEGVRVLSSCRAGVCGTCEVDVIEGTPEHRDSVLSEEEREENDFLLICCSRSLSSRLVLDL